VSIFGWVFFKKRFNWASHLCLYLDVLFLSQFLRLEFRSLEIRM